MSLLLATAGLALGLGAGPAGLAAPARAPGSDPVEARAPASSLWAPPLPRGVTRLRGTMRPFFNVVGQGGGAIADLSLDHYLARAPLRLSLEVTPLALAVQGDGPGAVGHFRVGAAYYTDYLEIGAAAGSRVQHYGAGGISMAGFLRLGALDGLKLAVTYGYVLRRNQYTGKATLGMSNILGTLEVPVADRLTLIADGAFSFDRWMYATLGLKHRLGATRAAGAWFVSGAFGVAWVVDRPDCPYPDTISCTGSAWGVGPTIAFGVERRF
jgi:hypothetical protein